MIQCPICSAENEPEAESCRGCGFGLSFSRYILDVVPVAAGPSPEGPGEREQSREECPPAERGGAPPEGARAEGLRCDEAAPATAEEALAEPPAGPDVDGLLENLRGEGPYYARLGALRKLGQLEASTPEIVKELLIARASGADKQTRDGAARLLHLSPHRQVLQRHPELLEAAAAEVRAAPPHRPAPLGPLKLPDWAAETRHQEPEPEQDAEVLARAGEMQKRAQDLTCIFGILIELLLAVLLDGKARSRS